MKFGAVFKLDKRNTTMLKKIDGDFISTNCDFQFMDNLVIRKQDSGRMVYKTHIFISSTCYLLKTENRIKKSLT